MVPPPETDGGTTERPPAPLDEGTLYVVIRKAVEDAILGVIGTLLLVGLALVLVWFGVMVTVSAFNSNRVMAMGGVFVILVGFYVALSALDVVPSIEEIL